MSDTDGSRSAKFELILTIRCQYCGGVDHGGRSKGRYAKFETLLGPLDVSPGEGTSAKFELILTTRCQYQGRVDLVGRSKSRSAKFELILTTRCKYQGG